jgi:SAM-dependent methyltransferase
LRRQFTYANDLASPSNSYASIAILRAPPIPGESNAKLFDGGNMYHRNDRPHAHARAEPVLRRVGCDAPSDVARAYDHVGDAYGCYADGDAIDEPEIAANRSAHADMIVWQAICKSIDEVRSQGASRLRILDAGCGPGTWLNRAVVRALRQQLDVEAVGFDISSGQLDIARKRVAGLLSRYRAVGRPKVEFVQHSLADPLPWPKGHFHMVLCNFAVLNHLPRLALAPAIAELCRVSSHRVIATLRALASPPTACIIGTEQVRELREDCARGQLAVVLRDGSKHVLTFNLYSAETLKALFASEAQVVDLRAIDLFLSRFAPDANWTEVLVNRLPGRHQVMERLKELEEPLCRLPGWVDHGTHVLIVAEPKP